MSKLLVTLVSSCAWHELTITRLPKRVDGGWKRPRCHTLKYASRPEGLEAYFKYAGRLAEEHRLHKGSAIEN